MSARSVNSLLGTVLIVSIVSVDLSFSFSFSFKLDFVNFVLGFYIMVFIL